MSNQKIRLSDVKSQIVSTYVSTSKAVRVKKIAETNTETNTQFVSRTEVPNQKVNLLDIQDQIITRGRKGEGKPKKHPSLYDSPIQNRTYWGDDDGSELLYITGIGRITSCLNKGQLFDVDDNILTRRLNRDYKLELKEFQIMMLQIMEEECKHQIIVVSNNNDEWILQFVI